MSLARILVVEDEAIIARSIASRLKQFGYEVAAIAPSGEKALQAVAETQPDLILMDIVLKGELDGIDTAAQVRQRWQIPVVYLTAYADASTLGRARETSPFGYILKPLRNNDFHATIQMALQKAIDENTLHRDKTVLLQEVEHRVKNNLQVITSLLNLQVAQTDNPQVHSALLETYHRVLAMAIAHQTVDLETHASAVHLPRYLRSLMDQLLRSLAVPRNQIFFRINIVPELKNLLISIDQAVPCGLIVNELFSTGIKQRLPQSGSSLETTQSHLETLNPVPDSSPTPTIQLSLSQTVVNQIVLSLTYSGNGMPQNWLDNWVDTNADRENLSQDNAPYLVKLLTEQLNGQFQIEQQAAGSRFILTFTLADCP